MVEEAANNSLPNLGRKKQISGQASLIALLHEKEARLKEAQQCCHLFDSAPEGIFQTTPSGRYLRVNPALARIYGYDSPDELMSALTDIQNQLYVEPQRRLEFVALIQQHGEVSGLESIVYRKDGRMIWIRETARARYDAAGAILYYQGFVEDITERKKAEVERNALVDELVELNQAFSRFVPSSALQLLYEKSGIDVQLGDSIQRESSVLAIEIVSGRSSGKAIASQGNVRAYLTCIKSIIQSDRGTIERDSDETIVASFRGSADAAVRAGIAILQQLREGNPHSPLPDSAPMRVSIGIHTKALQSGHVGRPHSLDSMAIGNTIGVANCLTGLAREYGVSLLISHRTLVSLSNPGNYNIRCVKQIKIERRSKPMTLFEVFDGDLPEVQAGKLATLRCFREGLFHYEHEAFLPAIHCFEQILRLNPSDIVAQRYLQQARAASWRESSATETSVEPPNFC
jgi:PAS domain S-box-containing protein